MYHILKYQRQHYVKHHKKSTNGKVIEDFFPVLREKNKTQLKSKSWFRKSTKMKEGTFNFNTKYQKVPKPSTRNMIK